jgi:WD40 repeat protein
MPIPCHDDPWTLIPCKEAMKHGLLTCRIALSALLLASIEPATAGFFGASKNDVAAIVAELPTPARDIYPLGLDFSPDGKHIAVDSNSENIDVWDWRNKRIEKTVEKPHGGNTSGTTNPIQYSPDGRVLAACEVSGSGDVVVRIWNTDNWSIEKDIVAGGGIESRGGCTGIGFTPDGKQFVRAARTAGRSGNNLVAYAIGAWQPLWGMQIEGFSPVSIAISPNGEQAAVAGTILVTPTGVIDPLQRSIESKIVANVNILDLKQRKVTRVIQSVNSGALAWSPDGKRVIVAGGPGIEVLDPLSGERLLHEELGEASHMNVRFTPDHRYFVESDLNGRGKGLGVKIWDSQHRELLQNISVGDVGSIAVSRDGKYLAVGETGRTTIWQFK